MGTKAGKRSRNQVLGSTAATAKAKRQRHGVGGPATKAVGGGKADLLERMRARLAEKGADR